MSQWDSTPCLFLLFYISGRGFKKLQVWDVIMGPGKLGWFGRAYRRERGQNIIGMNIGSYRPELVAIS